MFSLFRAAVAPAALALSIGACLSTPTGASAQDYTLRILHTNDVHARVDQVTRSGSYCTPKDATDKKCFGGYARIYSKIQELRASAPNVLVLDAGDRGQPDHHIVGPGADGVGSGTPVDGIETAAAEHIDRVVAATGVQRVIAAIAIKLIIPGIAAQVRAHAATQGRIFMQDSLVFLAGPVP